MADFDNSVSFSAFNYRRNLKTTLKISAAGVAITALLCATVYARENEAANIPTSEIVVLTGDTVDGVNMGGFSPVILSDFGAIFSAVNSSDILIADGSLSLLNGIIPRGFGFGNVNYTFENASSDDFTGYAFLDGSFGVDKFLLGDEIGGDPLRNSALSSEIFNTTLELNNVGNLSDAFPLLFGDQAAILVSNLPSGDVNEVAAYIFLSSDNGESFNLLEDTNRRIDATSLRFGGENRIFFSEYDFISSANSGLATNLFFTDILENGDTSVQALGPTGGAASYGGYSFFNAVGSEFPDPINGGARFIQGEFSLAGNIGTFLLDNVATNLDGTPGMDMLTQGLFVQFTEGTGAEIGSGASMVLLEGVSTQTDIGAVNFDFVEDVVAAADGSIYFRAISRDPDTFQQLSAGLWRVVNAGTINQRIEVVLDVGDLLPTDLVLGLEGGTQITGFDIGPNFREGRGDIRTRTSDGRPELLSVNREGRIATVVEISTALGNRRALIAQNDLGDFYLVAFEGQAMNVGTEEAPDLRTVSTFTAHFGSNDIDGFSDVYNAEEQLGFIVNFTDSTQAILRVNLNGEAEQESIDVFLFTGGCNTFEFSTTCQIGANPGTNFVNFDDQTSISEDVPGADGRLVDVISQGNFIEISEADVSINRLTSDAGLAISNSRTLSLASGGSSDTLDLDNGTLASGGTFTTREVNINGTATAGNIETIALNISDDLTVTDDIKVSNSVGFASGNVRGAGDILLENTENFQARTSATFSAGNLGLETTLKVAAGDVTFEDGVNLSIGNGGDLTLDSNSVATIGNGSISGVGDLFFSNKSSLKANGQVSITPDIEFVNADASPDEGFAAISLGAGSELNVDNLSFTREVMGPIDDSRYSLISGSESSRLVITEGHTLTVDDYLVFDAGTLQLDGQLNINSRGIFENRGSFQTQLSTDSSPNLEWDGLFRNQGAMVLKDGAIISSLFENRDNGTLVFEEKSGAKIAILAEKRDTIGNSFNLLADGIEAVTGLEITPNASLHRVSTLLEHLSLTGQSIEVRGDGAAFLYGNMSFQSSADFSRHSELSINSNSYFNGELYIGSLSSFLFNTKASDDSSLLNFSIIDSDKQHDFTLVDTSNASSGSSKATLNRALVNGISLDSLSGKTATGENNVVFRNRIANAKVKSSNGEFSLATEDVGTTRKEVLSRLIAGGNLLTVDKSTLQNIKFLNEGIAVLEDTTIAQNVDLDNAGYLVIGKGTNFSADNQQITNQALSRLDIEGLEIGNVSINNDGLVVISEEAGDVSVKNWIQKIDAEVDVERSQLIVESGAHLTIEQSNLTEENDANDGLGLNGRITANGGAIDFKSNGAFVQITDINASADIEIKNEGRINSVDENGKGLERIFGKISLAGRFDGDSLLIGEHGKTTFSLGAKANEITISSGGLLEVYAGSDQADVNTLDIGTFSVKGSFGQRSAGNSVFEILNVGAGGSVDFLGDVTTRDAVIDGLFTQRSSSGGDVNFSADLLKVSDGATMRVGTLEASSLAIGGTLVVEKDASNESGAMSIQSSGVVNFHDSASFSSLDMESNSRLEVVSNLTVRGANLSDIDASIQGTAASKFLFNGGLSLGNNGIISGRFGIGEIGELSTKSLNLSGRTLTQELEIFDGSLIISKTSLPVIDQVALQDQDFGRTLLSPANIVTQRLSVINGVLSNGGAIVITGNQSPSRALTIVGSSAGYDGKARSFMQIDGAARVSGSINFGGGAHWYQSGDLRATGSMREIGRNSVVVNGNVQIGSRASATTKSQNASDNVLVHHAAEPTSEHLINGEMIVTGDAEFIGGFTLSETGQVSIGGDFTITSSGNDAAAASKTLKEVQAVSTIKNGAPDTVASEPADTAAKKDVNAVSTIKANVPGTGAVSHPKSPPSYVKTAATAASGGSLSIQHQTETSGEPAAQSKNMLGGASASQSKTLSAPLAVSTIKTGAVGDAASLSPNKDSAEKKDGKAGNAVATIKSSASDAVVMSLPKAPPGYVKTGPYEGSDSSMTPSPDRLEPLGYETIKSSVIQASADGFDAILSGSLFVGGDAFFNNNVQITETGVTTIMGALTSLQSLDIVGAMQVGEDASFADVTIGGSLIVAGDITAESFNVTGFAQFGEGVFDNFALGDGAMVIADNFTTTGDFINQGTFQLGNPDAGASTFMVGGTFRQGGIFSGIGTIEGDFIQEVVDGGEDAANIILNPGFSPGFLNITGDATFNAGSIFMEIGGVIPGVDYDQINVAGNLLFGDDAQIIVDLLPLGGGTDVFIPQTGDEFVLFTGANINPDADQINLALADEVPLGVTFVTDITSDGASQSLRVRAFSGSNLGTTLTGLDQAQQGVASALDRISNPSAGLPSPILYFLARDLQFDEDNVNQRKTLTQTGATTAAAVLDNARTTGESGIRSAMRRLDSRFKSNGTKQAARQVPIQLASASASSGSNSQSDFDKMSNLVSGQSARQIAPNSKMSLFVEGGVLFGSGKSRNGAVGYDQSGWFASAGLEYKDDQSPLTAGLLINTANTESDLSQAYGTVEAESISGALYGQYDFGQLTADAVVSYSGIDVDTTRNALTGTLTGKGGGDLFSAAFRAKAALIETETFTAGPSAEISYTDFSSDPLIETGTGALNITDLDGSATDLRLSAFGQWTHDADGYSLNFRNRAGYSIALQGDKTSAAVTNFVSAASVTFETPLRPFSEDGFTAASNLEVIFNNSHSLALGYEGFFGGHGRENHSVSVKGRYVF